jgi:hypothetical protein
MRLWDTWFGRGKPAPASSGVPTPAAPPTSSAARLSPSPPTPSVAVRSKPEITGFASKGVRMLFFQTDPEVGGFVIQDIREFRPSLVLLAGWGGNAFLKPKDLQSLSDYYEVLVNDDLSYSWLMRTIEHVSCSRRPTVIASNIPRYTPDGDPFVLPLFDKTDRESRCALYILEAHSTGYCQSLNRLIALDRDPELSRCLMLVGRDRALTTEEFNQLQQLDAVSAQERILVSVADALETATDYMSRAAKTGGILST